MGNSKAIVTLLLGDFFIYLFKNFCYRNWSEYAARYGYDLVVITDPLDTSEKAQNRHKGWQKCLLPGLPQMKKYSQAVFIDADVLINTRESPCICELTPQDKVGAVDEFFVPDKVSHVLAKDRLNQFYIGRNLPPVFDTTAGDWYRACGIPPVFDQVVQTGVLVFSPQLHRDLFLDVYLNLDEDKNAPGEMGALSYGLLRAGAVHWLDARFNDLWMLREMISFPFLFSDGLDEKTLELKRKCATVAFANSYFMHFGGIHREMALVDTDYASVFNP